MAPDLSEHKHIIKYLSAIKPEMVIPSLDNLLSLKLINKKQDKLILNAIQTKL